MDERLGTRLAAFTSSTAEGAVAAANQEIADVEAHGGWAVATHFAVTPQGPSDAPGVTNPVSYTVVLVCHDARTLAERHSD